MTLTLTTSHLNSRVCFCELSALKMPSQRDLIPVNDWQLVLKQYSLCNVNHSCTERSTAPAGKITAITVLDLEYLHSDYHKLEESNRYLVTSIDDACWNIRKFVGSQLKNTSYRIKCSEFFKVLSHVTYIQHLDREDSNNETSALIPAPPDLPDIASVLSAPGEEILVFSMNPYKHINTQLPLPSTITFRV